MTTRPYRVMTKERNPHVLQGFILELLSDDDLHMGVQLRSAQLPWAVAEIGDVFEMPETKIQEEPTDGEEKT
jgi:hypothetical protein